MKSAPKGLTTLLGNYIYKTWLYSCGFIAGFEMSNSNIFVGDFLAVNIFFTRKIFLTQLITEIKIQ